LGHARTFLLTWALARNQGWEILLRLEDLDRERVKEGAIEEAIAVLRWLGIDWDGPISIQSAHLDRFRAAMEQLAGGGHVFRCDRSRQDVRRAASAPHRDDGEIRFPPELRAPPQAFGFRDPLANHRLLVNPSNEEVVDELFGPQTFDPGSEVGDFLVWTKLGCPSYQLAVVVDDAHFGITDVVRGEDLLSSAARQQLLYRHLQAPLPRWWHLPLVYGSDGERLAKRRGDTALNELRARGVRAERLIGLIAHVSGLTEEATTKPMSRPVELSPADFQRLVQPDTLRAMVDRERRGARATASEDSIRWLLNP
jgi:glutamyl-tRNA synthetase